MKRAHRASALAVAGGVVAAALTLLAPSNAHAIERQHHLGLAPSLALLKVDDKSTMSIGAGGALHYAYGLNDQWNFMVEAGSAVVAADQQLDFPDSPRTRPATVDHATIGAGYVIDILRWVPYVSLMGGAYRLAGGTLPESLFLAGASAGVGLDYQLSRQFAVGVAGRQHFLLTKMSTYPTYTTVSFRIEFMWGY